MLFVVDTHEAVTLIALFLGILGSIHRDQVIVGAKSMDVGVVIGKNPCLEHLIRGNGDAIREPCSCEMLDDSQSV